MPRGGKQPGAGRPKSTHPVSGSVPLWVWRWLEARANGRPMHGTIGRVLTEAARAAGAKEEEELFASIDYEIEVRSEWDVRWGTQVSWARVLATGDGRDVRGAALQAKTVGTPLDALVRLLSLLAGTKPEEEE